MVLKSSLVELLSELYSGINADKQGIRTSGT